MLHKDRGQDIGNSKSYLWCQCKKILVKGKWSIFDPKMMHPYFSGSILQILILLKGAQKLS